MELSVRSRESVTNPPLPSASASAFWSGSHVVPRVAPPFVRPPVSGSKAPASVFYLSDTRLEKRPSYNVSIGICLNQILPIGRPRARTNSERGRAFRERQRKYEQDLVSGLEAMRKEIEDLKELRNEVSLAVPRTGALNNVDSVRLAALKYFDLFHFGLAGARSENVSKRRWSQMRQEEQVCEQMAFLESVMDPEVKFLHMSGIPSIIDQWRNYTSYHATFRVVVEQLEVRGAAECPIADLKLNLYSRFSLETFIEMFPHVAHDYDFMNRFIGKEVMYSCAMQLHFNEKRQIEVYDADVSFADSLLSCGVPLDDVSRLLQSALIQDQCVIGASTSPRVDKPIREVLEDHWAMNDDGSRKTPTHSSSASTDRLKLEYILS